MKFELNRLNSYTDEDILDEIRRVINLVGEEKFNSSVFSKHSKVSKTTVTNRFGSWKNALERSGNPHLYKYKGTISNKVQNQSAKNYTDEDLISELKKVAHFYNRDQLTQSEFDAKSNISSSAIRLRFGTWKEAVVKAGLELVPLAKRYTDVECFENLLTVWSHYSRPPTYEEMSLAPSCVGGKAYTRRFGSWKKALTAFVEKINSDQSEECENIACHHNIVENVSGDSNESILTEERNAPIQEPKMFQRQEDRRSIPLGLRFKVMHRDHFKCVLCGNNPPASPGLILHVDHILPWSKGGKTEIDNLRTLCADCNIGRSNKYAD